MQKSDIDLTPQNLPRHCSKSSEEDIGLQLSDKGQVEKRGSINFSVSILMCPTLSNAKKL